MTYFVYLLARYKDKKLITYAGYTNNLKRRLSLHNRGKGAKFTKGRTWKLIYYEKHRSRKEAINRECYIKKDRKFRNLIKNKYK